MGTGNTTCTHCPGEKTHNSTKTDCVETACPPEDNTYLNNDGSCELCERGERPNDNRNNCEDCPKGTYGSSRSVCTECPDGKYQDEEGEEHTVMMEGLGARCVQHEVDHLNGILFLQRASRLKIERAMKARKKARKKRIEYEKRVALAKYFQELQSKNDSKPDVDGEMSGDDTISQES